MKDTRTAKRYLLIFSAVAVISTNVAFSSVTINLGIGRMNSSTNNSTPFPKGGLLNLLSLDSGTWAGLGDLNSLFSTLNSFTPAGTTLVGQIYSDDSSGPGSANGAINFNYTGAFNAGDQLMLVAYPNPLCVNLGFFFRTDSVIDGSDIAWVAPANGSTVSLFAYTLDEGGSLPNNQFTTGPGAAGGNGFGNLAPCIPEPSTYALLLMGAGAMWFWKRRK
jgi:hypothetical protein